VNFLIKIIEINPYCYEELWDCELSLGLAVDQPISREPAAKPAAKLAGFVLFSKTDRSN
jgi:hypothetical protein